MNNAKCYIKGYPRPQFVRNNWVDLNGEWDFVFDDENIGEVKGWFNNFPASCKINVPYAYQTSASGINEEKHHEIMWYAKKQHVENLEKDERLFINFEGSDYLTKVWCNGIYLGEHKGGYCRFCFDLTDSIKDNEANIVVKVVDDLSCTKPRGKQSWMSEPWGCWYTATSGIWKTVWLEKVNNTKISHIKMTPIEETYHFNFEYEIDNFKKGLSLKTIVSYKNEVIADNSMRLIRGNHTYSIDFSNDQDCFKIHFWTPETPEFYDIKFILMDENGNVIDEVGSYTAWRTFKAENNMLKLNLNPIYLKMVLQQGYFRESGLTVPSEEELLQELVICKELGFNGIRMHQKIEDERFYYFADMLGMLVWCELPSSYEFKDVAIENITREWMEVVKQFYNHPSIVTWVPVNESWGVNRITTNVNEQSFATTLYYLTKSFDSMRPVISNDGWEHTKSDIITFHNYAQDYKDLEHFYDSMNDMLKGKNINEYNQLRVPFAKGYKYEGQPIMLDEFAGIGFKHNLDEGWGYGKKVKTEEEFLERLSSLIRSVKKYDSFCGYCVTQITDVYQEINGLLDFDRKYKSSKEKLIKALKGE